MTTFIVFQSTIMLSTSSLHKFLFLVELLIQESLNQLKSGLLYNKTTVGKEAY